MSNDLNVALTLSLKDKLVGPLAKAVGDIEREFKDLEKTIKGLNSSIANVSDKLESVGKQKAGVRSAAQGVAELGNEASNAERKMSLLERTTGRLLRTLKDLGTVNGAVGAYKNISTGVAGVAAFDHVVADPIKRAADYDTRLRYMVGTAYRGKSLGVKQSKMAEIDSAITSAIRFGGGNREDVSDALEHLIKSAAFGGVDENISLLPSLTKTGTASGASATEMAQLAIALKRNLGIGVKQLPLALGRVLVSSQMGSFKVSDTAQHIAELAPGLKLTGMSGLPALNELLAMNEAAIDTAGSPGQAATNVAQMLKDEMAPFTQRFFKKRGIDLPGSVQNLVLNRGMSPHQAFLAVADQMSRHDPKYLKIQKQYEDAPDESGKKSALESMVEYQKGMGLASVFHNTEAMRAIMAQLTQRKQVEKILGAIGPSQDAKVLGAVEDAHSFISEGPGYKYGQRQFEEQQAQTKALGSANGALSKLADAETDLYRRYPGFASALEGAKVAVSGFTAALAAMGVMRLLTGAGAAAAAAAGAGGATAAAGLAGESLIGAGSLGVGGAVATGTAFAAGSLALAGGGGWLIGKGINKAIDGTSAADNIGSMIAMLASTFSQEARDSRASMQAYAKMMADRPLEVRLDTGVLVGAINAKNARDMRRQ